MHIWNKRKYQFYHSLYNAIKWLEFYLVLKIMKEKIKFDEMFIKNSITDSIYTERFMGLPSDNLHGYEQGQLLNKVDNIKTKMYYLIHGTLDDNVHYQQSLLLAKVLEQKDILFRQQVRYSEDLSSDNWFITLYFFAILSRNFVYFWKWAKHRYTLKRKRKVKNVSFRFVLFQRAYEIIMLSIRLRASCPVHGV